MSTARKPTKYAAVMHSAAVMQPGSTPRGRSRRANTEAVQYIAPHPLLMRPELTEQRVSSAALSRRTIRREAFIALTNCPYDIAQRPYINRSSGK
jgi:hypothetical protein